MSCEDEVLRIGKKVEKMVSSDGSGQEQAMDLLNSLKDLPITLDVLQKTRIGMSVNALRKSSKDEDVISLSKQLIKNWKKLLSARRQVKQTTSALVTDVPCQDDEDPSASSDRTPSSGKSDGTKESSKESGGSSKSTISNREKDKDKERPPSPQNQMQNIFPRTASDTTNEVRLKCRELLANSLKCDDIQDGFLDPEELAALIEDAVFKEFRNTDMKYKNRVRSRVANLKDTKNPTLRENVLLGVISPEKIAIMTADEMASAEMKELRTKFTKESINDHQMAVTGGTSTNLLKCGKCKKRNCSYNQVQTRSADEPMTTFVYCNDCGHRWKFC